MFKWYRFAVVCLIVSCIPPAGTYPPQQQYSQEQQQDEWQQEPAAPPIAYEDEGDPAADFSGSGRKPDRARGKRPDARNSNTRNGTARSGGSTWFLCTAQGSMGTAYGDGPWSYSTETAYGGGPTRDVASLKALEDCNAMMSMSASLAISSGQKRDGGTCDVVDCISQTR